MRIVAPFVLLPLLALLSACASSLHTVGTLSRDVSRASASGRRSQQGPAPTLPPLDATAFTLGNGLRVILLPSQVTSRVAVLVTYDVGSIDDPAGYHGLAHTTEHALFTGTRHLDEPLEEALARAGVSQSNAETHPRRTVYYEAGPAGALDTMLWLESERLGFALDRVREESVARDRAVVIEEYHQRVTTRSLGAWREIFATTLYPAGHPLHDDWEREGDLDALHARHVQWFFQTWYAPDNAALTVVGDFDAPRARATIERLFADIPRGRPRPPHPAEVLPRMPPADIVVEAGLHNEEVRIYWPTPAWATTDDFTLDVVADALQPILEEAVVHRDGALEVEVQQSSDAHGSFFEITAIAAESSDAESVARSIWSTLERSPGILDAATIEAIGRGRQFGTLRTFEDPLDLATRVALSPEAEDPGKLRRSFETYGAVTLESAREVLVRCVLRVSPRVFLVRKNPRAPFTGRVSRRLVPSRTGVRT